MIGKKFKLYKTSTTAHRKSQLYKRPRKHRELNDLAHPSQLHDCGGIDSIHVISSEVEPGEVLKL